MNFNVYKDSGPEIHGYFVSDNFSGKPSVRVVLQGEQEYIIDCTEYIAGAYENRAHETGIIGFVLNQEKIPDLSADTYIEISDPESGFVFYKRFDPDRHIKKRVLRMETQFVPHSEVDTSLQDYFQFFAKGIELYGFETVRQMLEVKHQPSTYVSGRILYKSYQIYIDDNIEESIISLRDPFYELALRLFVLSYFKKRPFHFFPKRDAIIFQPAIEHFHDLKIQDETAVRRRLKSASKEVISLLESPFTHQLTAESPSDKPRLEAISLALRVLSEFTYVDTGSGSDHETLKSGLAQLLAIPEEAIRLSGRIKELVDFANILREESLASHMLEADLILYHFIQKAEEKSAT